jgi:hypothetical protein
MCADWQPHGFEGLGPVQVGLDASDPIAPEAVHQHQALVRL